MQKINDVINYLTPLTTEIGQLVGTATDANLPSVSWETNLRITDLLNKDIGLTTGFLRAVRKRLLHESDTTRLYTLVLLETVVKNCNDNVTSALLTKELCDEIYECPLSSTTKNKSLSLIESWSECFHSNKTLSDFHTQLLEKGVEFPPRDMDAMAPIRPHHYYMHPVQLLQRKLNTQEEKKLRGDLDIVGGNLEVFEELLFEGEELLEGEELGEELFKSLKEMQKRTEKLISSISSDCRIFSEFLEVNDRLNNAIKSYEGKNKTLSSQEFDKFLEENKK